MEYIHLSQNDSLEIDLVKTRAPTPPSKSEAAQATAHLLSEASLSVEC